MNVRRAKFHRRTNVRTPTILLLLSRSLAVTELESLKAVYSDARVHKLIKHNLGILILPAVIAASVN